MKAMKNRLHTLLSVSLMGLAGLALHTSAEAQSARFYERKAEGWFWYAREPEPVPEPEEPEPVPEPVVVAPAQPSEQASVPEPGPSVLSAVWLNENMPKYLQAAIDNPTMDNTRAYLYLQRIAMDKAERYAQAVQLATMGDPYLDETTRRPLANFAVPSVDASAGKAKGDLVMSIAEKAGLFVFFSSQCALCEVQAPLLKSLAQHEGFSVIPVSLDGQNLVQNPFEDFRTDDGHAEMLGVQTLPALFLASPNGKFAPIGQGAFALPDLQQRIVVAAFREGWISEDEFNRTRPLVSYDNLANLIADAGIQDDLDARQDSNGLVPQNELMKRIRHAIGGR